MSSVSALFGQTTEPQANNGSGKTWDVKLGTVWLVFHPHNLSSLVFRSLVLRTRIIRPDFIDDFLHSQVCHKQTPRGMKWHCGAHGLPDQYSELRRPPHHLSLEIDSAGSCDRSAYRDFSVDPIGIAGTDCGVLINVSTQLGQVGRQVANHPSVRSACPSAFLLLIDRFFAATLTSNAVRTISRLTPKLSSQTSPRFAEVCLVRTFSGRMSPCKSNCCC